MSERGSRVAIVRGEFRADQGGSDLTKNWVGEGEEIEQFGEMLLRRMDDSAAD